MKEKITLTLLLMVIAISSVVTIGFTYASNDDDDDEETVAEDMHGRFCDANPSDFSCSQQDREQSDGDGVIGGLPPCDGSFQDCITEDGNVCNAGSDAHECEMSVTCPDGITTVEELSDCPDPEPDGDKDNNGVFDRYEEEDYVPNPYCDLVPDDYQGSCHDRKDYDQRTGLYPCNDGIQKADWRDCDDASGYDYGKDNTIEQLQPDISQPDIQIGPEKNETYESMHSGEFGTENEWNRNCFDQGTTDSQKGEYSEETAKHCGDFAQGKKSYDQGFNAASVDAPNNGNNNIIEVSESSNPLIRANEWNQSCYNAGLHDGKLGSFNQETKGQCDDNAEGGLKYHMGYDDGVRN